MLLQSLLLLLSGRFDATAKLGTDNDSSTLSEDICMVGRHVMITKTTVNLYEIQIIHELCTN